LIRRLRLFQLSDDPDNVEGLLVSAIHDERGYRRIRRELARQYDVGWIDPHIEIVDVDLAGDRRLILRHVALNGGLLEETDARRVLQHLADLWTYDVVLREVDKNDKLIKEHVVSPRASALAA
jgi:stage V sporulation protein R